MFWPMAIVSDPISKKTYSLHTYDGQITLEDAKKIINNWKLNDKLHILCAYITDDETKQVVYLENNVDTFGNVHYKEVSEEDIELNIKK